MCECFLIWRILILKRPPGGVTSNKRRVSRRHSMAFEVLKNHDIYYASCIATPCQKGV